MLLTTYIQKNWKINRQNLRKTHLIKNNRKQTEIPQKSINSHGIKERGEFFSVLLLIFIFVYKIIRPKYALNFMCFLSYLSYFKNPSINAINFATKLRQCMSILVVNNTSCAPPISWFCWMNQLLDWHSMTPFVHICGTPAIKNICKFAIMGP